MALNIWIFLFILICGVNVRLPGHLDRAPIGMALRGKKVSITPVSSKCNFLKKVDFFSVARAFFFV